MTKTCKSLSKVLGLLECREFYTIGDFNKDTIVCESPIVGFPLFVFNNLCKIYGLNTVVILANKNYKILVTGETGC